MTESEIKMRLTDLLAEHHPGHLLHTVSDIYATVADEARQSGDQVTADKANLVSQALVVFACGLHAVLPLGTKT